MARMAGNTSPSWCPACHATPGPDCPDAGRSPRQIRRQLKRDLHREVAREESPSEAK